jgi:uncharacterized membrane protein
MSDLVAIGYDDAATALEALDAAEGLAGDLVIPVDALAVIIRDGDGRFKTVTDQHLVGSGATWGLFWGVLFGILFFVPVLGMAFGAALGAVAAKVKALLVEDDYEQRVRDLLKPGTSALFLLLEQITAEKTLEALSKFGGTVVRTSLSDADERELQEALHGAAGAR